MLMANAEPCHRSSTKFLRHEILRQDYIHISRFSTLLSAKEDLSTDACMLPHATTNSFASADLTAANRPF